MLIDVGDSISWYESTGYLSGIVRNFGRPGSHTTSWHPTGELDWQVPSGGNFERSPPWRWGDEDQTEPTAPWVRAGRSVDEWWESLPDHKKRRPR